MTNLVSVIVPVFNDWDRLNKLVNSMIISLRLAGHLDIEVVIVDNGINRSEFDLNEFELQGLTVRLYHCSQPGSYAARNFGVNHSHGNILVFVDSDVYFDSNYFLEFKNTIRGQEKILFVAGNISIFREAPDSSDFVVAYEMVLGLPQRYYIKRGRAVTANLVVSKELFLAVDGFNSDLKSGGDFDFCMRVQAIRKDIILEFEEKLLVHHPSRKNIRELYCKSLRVAKGQLDIGAFRFFRYLVRASVGMFIDIFRIIDSRRHFDTTTLMKCALFSPVMSLIRISSAVQVLVRRNKERR